MPAPAAALTVANVPPPAPSIHEVANGRELLALLYRLARKRATGLVAIARPGDRRSALILRRGMLLLSARDEAARSTAESLRRWVAEPRLHVRFDGGLLSHPPGGAARQVHLDGWIIAFFGRSLTVSHARTLAADLAGARIAVRTGLAPDPERLDEADRRILLALAVVRRLDEIPTLARAPKFRVLALLFALRSVEALETSGVAAPVPGPDRAAAHRLLGLSAAADRAQVKRAYRRLARALHPDLHPRVDRTQRAALESKLAEINRAYRSLI